MLYYVMLSSSKYTVFVMPQYVRSYLRVGSQMATFVAICHMCPPYLIMWDKQCDRGVLAQVKDECWLLS